MKLEWEGRIGNIRLAHSKALHPLFEAIVNSIDAIEERGAQDGRIDVHIERDQQQKVMEDVVREEEKPIVGFKVVDNGVGFDEKNFNAFETSDTTYKRSKGGKGVGRLLWLKTFKKVQIRSVFVGVGGLKKRSFDFLAKGEGVENLKLEDAEAEGLETTVHLDGFKKDYQDACVKNPDAIALRIVDHCLVHFISPQCPKITLHDGDVRIDVNSVYERMIKKATSEETFQVGKSPFAIRHLKLAVTPGGGHRVHYCANGREVCCENLHKLIPDATRALTDENNSPFFYSGYVSGGFLDERVNSERTAFDIPTDDLLGDNGLKWSDIQGGVREVASKHLESPFEQFRHKKMERIEEFVKHQAPRYRALVKHRKDLVQEIPGDLSDDKLEIELHKRQATYEVEIKRKSQELLECDFVDAEDLPGLLERFTQLLQEVNDTGKTQLAEYIAKRKLIIELFEKTLRIGDVEKYRAEENVHRIIFPLRSLSDDIDYNQHNLWMIDEKLAYHMYLASDKELRDLDVLETQSEKRPDIIIFDSPFAFVDEETPFQSVVILEFKRPGRTDYGRGKNPFEQVYGYVREIKEGKAKDKHGRPISVTGDVPFYAYIVCDLVPKMRELAETAGLKKAPDNMGYFGYNPNFTTYVEVLGFDKVVGDAKKRNQILFDKLGLG
ncbi:MAG: ATP-binding protein [Sedimentisphaerales bacterium]|nr:ATP-binding protein [Sedimentisphaerales bacterium]